MMAVCLQHMRLCLLQLPGDVPAAGLPLEVLQDLHGRPPASDPKMLGDYRGQAASEPGLVSCALR